MTEPGLPETAQPGTAPGIAQPEIAPGIALPGIAQPRRRSPKLVIATVFTVLGIGFAALALMAHSSQALSTSRGAPPRYVHLSAGDTYMLSVPGGIGALNAAGLPQASIVCTSTDAASGQVNTLSLVAEPADSRATTAFARFTAVTTGLVAIDCLRWGAVYVDDADDAPRDMAFGYLLACAITLSIGAGLLLSVLRSGSTSAPTAA